MQKIAFYIIIFFISISANKKENENKHFDYKNLCKNKTSIEFKDGAIKEINIAFLSAFGSCSLEGGLTAYEEYSSILSIIDSTIKFWEVGPNCESTYGTFPIILIDDFAIPFNQNVNYKYPFNFLIKHCKPIQIDKPEAALQYFDFYLRLYSDLYLGFYRINKYLDIYYYPQYYNYKYERWQADGKLSEESAIWNNKTLMVESMPDYMVLKYEPEEYQNFEKAEKTINKEKIKPPIVQVTKKEVKIKTFIANGNNGNIEYWKIRMTKNGLIKEIKKKTIYEKVGIDAIKYRMGTPHNINEIMEEKSIK